MANNSGNPRVLAVTEGGTGGTSAGSAKQNIGLNGLIVVGNNLNYSLNLDASGLSETTTLAFPDISVANLGAVVIKSTTGDPSVPEGVIVINTTDNNVKIMADGALRSLATW